MNSNGQATFYDFINNGLSGRRGGDYLNLPYMIATLSQNTTIGKGLLFDSSDQELLTWHDKWYLDNHVEYKLRRSNIWGSMLGASMLFILPMRDGTFTFATTPLSYMGRVSTVDEKETSANIWYYPDMRDDGSFVNIKITKDHFIRTDYAHLQGSSDESLVGDLYAPISEKDKVVDQFVWPNTLGVVPVVLIYNRVPMNFYTSTMINYFLIPDTFNAWPLIKEFNNLVKIAMKERDYNRTRLFGSFNDQEWNKFLKKEDIKKLDAQDFIINVPSMQGGYQATAQPPSLLVLPGDPKFEQYIKMMNYYLDLIFKAAGYNYQDYDSMTYENKTRTEKSDSLTTETKLEKQRRTLEGLYRLYDIIIKLNFPDKESALDGKERLFKLSFIDAQAIEDMKKIEVVDARLNNKTMSHKEAIKILDGVNDKMAEAKLQEMAEEQTKYGESLFDSMETTSNEHGEPNNERPTN